MANYSIQDLAKLSGIKAHTIRIWEQRYGVIEPKRTASNIRYYTDEDLKFVMNIAFLNRKGIRISKIAKMSKEKIAQEVERLSKTEAEHTDHFQNLAMGMMELDSHKICSLLSQCFEQNGVEDTIVNVLIPFLEKVSLLWLAGSINTIHEQFASSLIRRKILTAISELKTPKIDKNIKVLLFLPEDDQQELYLIFVEYLLKKAGIEVIYLGTGLHLEDLQLACSIHNPQYAYTIISEHHKCYVPDDYIHSLSQALPNVKVLVSGFQDIYMKDDSLNNVIILEDLGDLIDFFAPQG